MRNTLPAANTKTRLELVAANVYKDYQRLASMIAIEPREPPADLLALLEVLEHMEGSAKMLTAATDRLCHFMLGMAKTPVP